jgi:hypothetical protein
VYDVLLIASCLLFAGICFAYARHEAASLFHPATIYLGFHGFIFVIRPLFARWYGFDLVYRVYDFQPSMADKITVILGANLAMLVFTGVTLLAAGRPVIAVPAQARFDELRRSLAGPIVAACVLLAPLAIASQLVAWSRRVDPYATMARDAGTGIMVNVGSNGWFDDSSLMLAPLTVLVVWLLRYRPAAWAGFALSGVLMLGSGGRGSFIFAAVALAMIYLLEKRRSWFEWKIALLAAASLASFNLVVIDRGAAVREAFGAETGEAYTSAYELDPLEHMDFANLEYFEFIVYAVPRRSGSWDYFAHNLQIFTEPVPRALWKGKPIGSPVKFFELWDYGTPIGMTISLPGAGWMSLGYPGIAVQAAFFALLYGWVYTRLLTRSGEPLPRLAYALFAATSLVVFRDGILLTLLRQLPFYFGPFVLVLAVARFVSAPLPRLSATAGGQSGATSPAERRKELARRA